MTALARRPVSPARPARPAARLTLAASVAACSAALAAGGCGYTLRGQVVLGEASYVTVVDRDDPRLDGAPVPGASLHLQLDPHKPQRKSLGTATSGGAGDFAMSVNEFGAGVLDLDVAVFSRRPEFTPAEGYFRLPDQGRRVLVVMAPGTDFDLGDRREGIAEEAERLWRTFD